MKFTDFVRSVSADTLSQMDQDVQSVLGYETWYMSPKFYGELSRALPWSTRPEGTSLFSIHIQVSKYMADDIVMCLDRSGRMRIIKVER